jgi:DNA repair protein RecO (recombination protein O)
MSIEKTEAIILHSRKQGETSKILTVFSNLFGKMSLMAKGARNPKSKFLGTLNTFNHVSLVFYRKENRDIQYISQADIINSFESIHQSLGKMALAAIPAEMIDKNEPLDHANPQLFKLFKSTFETLNNSTTGLKNIIRSFKLKFVEISGFSPMLEKCHNCEKTNISQYHYFDLERGFYTCELCGIPTEVNYKLAGKALEFLRWFYQTPVGPSALAKVSSPIGKQIDEFLILYIKYHFEHLRHLKSLKFLK